MRLTEARLVVQTAVAFSGRRYSYSRRGVASLSGRNPEAEANVKGATRLCSSREHRPANGEGSSAFRLENQAFRKKWLIQRIVEPLPVERALARSRRRFTLDAGGSLGRIAVLGATPSGLVGWGGASPRPPSLTNRGVGNAI